MPDCYWYKNYHSPIISHPGAQTAWPISEKLHRISGPAIECSDGSVQWWVNGKRYHDLNEFCDAARITGLARTMFLLKWR